MWVAPPCIVRRKREPMDPHTMAINTSKAMDEGDKLLERAKDISQSPLFTSILQDPATSNAIIRMIQTLGDHYHLDIEGDQYLVAFVQIFMALTLAAVED